MSNEKCKPVTLSAILKSDKELDRIDTKFQWFRWHARKEGLGDAMKIAAEKLLATGIARAGEYLAIREDLMKKRSRVYKARTVRHQKSEAKAKANTAPTYDRPERYVRRAVNRSLNGFNRTAHFARS